MRYYLPKPSNNGREQYWQIGVKWFVVSQSSLVLNKAIEISVKFSKRKVPFKGETKDIEEDDEHIEKSYFKISYDILFLILSSSINDFSIYKLI